jgi:hypothetical protein
MALNFILLQQFIFLKTLFYHLLDCKNYIHAEIAYQMAARPDNSIVFALFEFYVLLTFLIFVLE